MFDFTNFLHFTVLDSIGKISDGWFENTKSLCDALYLICQAMEEDSVIRKALENIEIPRGNTNNLGAYEECLSVSDCIGETV